MNMFNNSRQANGQMYSPVYPTSLVDLCKLILNVCLKRYRNQVWIYSTE